MGRVLLVLNSLATFNLHRPHQTAFAGIGQRDAIVARLDHIDFPDRLAAVLPIMGMNNTFPFTEFFHPAFPRFLSIFNRCELRQDFSADVWVQRPSWVNDGFAFKGKLDHRDKLFRRSRRQVKYNRVFRFLPVEGFRIFTVEQSSRINFRLEVGQVKLSRGGPVKHAQEQSVPFTRHIPPRQGVFPG